MGMSRQAFARVELNIDELVLDGFAPGDRHRLADAFHVELARLLGERGVPSSLHSRAGQLALDAGGFRLPPGARPEAAGVQAARVLYASLDGSPTPRGGR
jgi:hypothetical protein